MTIPDKHTGPQHPGQEQPDQLGIKAPEEELATYSSLDDIFATGDPLLEPELKPVPPSSEERLVRSFAEITEFVREHGREPSAETHNISERKLGARLAGIRINDEKVQLLADHDEMHLLAEEEPPVSLDDIFAGDNFDELMGELVDDAGGLTDMSTLPSVKAPSTPESVERRHQAEDFDAYRELFPRKHRELAAGQARQRKYSAIDRAHLNSVVHEGAFFILGGQMLYIAEFTKDATRPAGPESLDPVRLRVIFENGTESNMLRNSFLKRLVEDEHSTVIVDNETLDETNLLKDEGVTGTLYVLRTLSDDPQVSGYPNLHKIGYTTTSLEKRLARAPFEPAYLNAPVEVVASYTLYGLNVGKVEKTMHRLFAPARLSIKQTAANGQSINIVEWFDVPLPVIDKAVDLLGKNQLHGYSYNHETRQLVKH